MPSRPFAKIPHYTRTLWTLNYIHDFIRYGTELVEKYIRAQKNFCYEKMKEQNYHFYETGWIKKFLDPRNQPNEIKKYLETENKILLEMISENSRLVDFGCGFGRHLELLREKLKYGLGIDSDAERIKEGQERLRQYPNLELRVADARDNRLPKESFDFSICMHNTLGNIKEQKIVIAEMCRVLVPNGKILAGVYSTASIPARIEWYQRTGLVNVHQSEEYILGTDPKTSEVFRSQHFTPKRLRELFGKCKIKDITEIGYLVVSLRNDMTLER